MKKLTLLVILLIGLNTACSTSGDDPKPKSENDNQNIRKPLPDITPILEAQGIDVIDKCTYHDKTSDQDYTGYLGVYRGKVSSGIYHNYCDKNGENCDESKKVTNAPKYCLVLTGTSYSMGYQEGYLRPLSVKKMTELYMMRALFEQFGLLGISSETFDKYNPELYNWFYKNIKKMIDREYEESFNPENIKNGTRIPTYMFDEMQGITDGANAALKEKGDDYSVEFENVFAISEGIDGLFSFIGQFLFGPEPDAEMLSEIAELVSIIGTKELESIFKINNGKLEFFPNRNPFPFLKFGCNGFMVTGNATADGKTYMGRDFMFSTADVLQDESLVMVFLPEKGTGYPFVAVGPPSFVGQCVGINSEGLSVGIDISLSGAFSRDTGVGSLIILRELLQNTSDIDGAVSRFRKFERGVPWNFVVAAENGSDKYGNGVILEVGRNDLADDYMSTPDNNIPPEKGFTGPDVAGMVSLQDLLLFNSMKAALTKAGSEDLNPDGTIKGGTMVRGAKWKYPDIEILKDRGRDRDADSNDLHLADIESYKKYYSSGYKFHEQGENDDDVLIVTNHFIIPRMRMSQFHPITNYGYNMGALADMVWRYEYMEQLIKDYSGNIGFFGDGDRPDVGSAGWIIDFLNPNIVHPGSRMPDGMKDKYYVPDSRDVDGLHVVMNNTDKELRGLFGYLPDPWVGIKLMPLVEWWNSQQQ